MAYAVSRAIVIDSTKVPGDLTDYPFGFIITEADLATVGNGGSVQNTDLTGGASGVIEVPADMIFAADALGVTVYNHEFEFYDPTTGEIVAWVEVPSVTSGADTTLYILYGDAAVVNSQENIAAVWDANFKMVQHMQGAGWAELDDSTVNATDADQDGGAPTYQNPGQIAYDIYFDGTNDVIKLDGNLGNVEGLNEGTFEGWFTQEANGLNSGFFISDKDSNNDFVGLLIGAWTGDYADESLAWLVRRGGATVLYMVVRNGENFYNDSNRHHVVVITGDADNRILIDGVSQAITFAAGNAATNEFTNINNPDTMWMAGRDIAAAETFLTGELDEVRISDSARSDDYAQTTYNNTDDPLNFFELAGAEGPNREIDQVVLVLEAGQETPDREIDQVVLVIETGRALVPPMDCIAQCIFYERCALITWDDISTTEDGYEVQRQEESGPWTSIADLAVNAEAYEDCDVALARIYTYRIRSFRENPDGSRIYSDWCVTNSVYCLFAQEWTDLDLEAGYIIAVRDTDGVLVALVDAYDKLDYTRKLDNQGVLSLDSSTALVDPDYFELDYMIEVWRAAPGQDWREDFTAFHRYKEFRYDDTYKEWLRCVGPGLENLLRRRRIIPDVDEAYLTIDDHFTDTMRELVRTQCSASAQLARQFPGFTVEADSHEGVQLSLNYRYTKLFDEVEILGKVGAGADFDVVHLGAADFEFRVYYEHKGLDCRVGNTDGNPPVIFSIEMANMQRPKVEDERLKEVTIVYVGGEGVGADREVVVRSSISGAENDSPWNRIEEFLEARHETSTGALMALGDAFLAENQQVVEFSCNAVPTPVCLYGVNWDLGYLVTGYYRNLEFDMKVVEVHVTVDADGEKVMPTFEVIGWHATEEDEEEYEYWA